MSTIETGHWLATRAFTPRIETDWLPPGSRPDIDMAAEPVRQAGRQMVAAVNANQDRPYQHAIT